MRLSIYILFVFMPFISNGRYLTFSEIYKANFKRIHPLFLYDYRQFSSPYNVATSMQDKLKKIYKQFNNCFFLSHNYGNIPLHFKNSPEQFKFKLVYLNITTKIRRKPDDQLCKIDILFIIIYQGSVHSYATKISIIPI